MSAENIVGFKQLEPTSAYSDRLYNQEAASRLAGLLADKGISGDAAATLAGNSIAGDLLSRYLIGEYELNGDPGSRDSLSERMNSVVLLASGLVDRSQPIYTGSLYENRDVTTASYLGSYSNTFLRQFRRNGASREFRTGLVDITHTPESLNLPLVPIAVVGAGASGVLTARALIEAGFDNVDVFDKRGEVAGLWNQDNVNGGTKNNPFDIRYDNHIVGGASNLIDVAGSGLDIQRFVHSIAEGSRHPRTTQHKSSRPLEVQAGLVKEIEPGDLNHILRIKIAGKDIIKGYPIVVYAPGIGEPMPLSHEGHMTTSATRKEAGIRWQQQLSPEKLRELAGKRVVFVGLGNSTAEMVHQPQQYEDQTGRRIDYRIITHYPHQVLRVPTQRFASHSALYRDTTKPELTKLAGDLRHIDFMYRRAFEEGKVVGDVSEWHVDNGMFVAVNRDGVRTSIPYDQVYTLTGYRQNPDLLKKFGIEVLDEYSGAIAFDYDGEIQRKQYAKGRDRVHAGYFAIGPILKTKFNPNAVVIPGIQGQLNNLLPTLVLRATEYALRRPEVLAAIRQVRAETRAQIQPAKRNVGQIISGLLFPELTTK